jgi:hypothetical protein
MTSLTSVRQGIVFHTARPKLANVGLYSHFKFDRFAIFVVFLCADVRGWTDRSHECYTSLSRERPGLAPSSACVNFRGQRRSIRSLAIRWIVFSEPVRHYGRAYEAPAAVYVRICRAPAATRWTKRTSRERFSGTQDWCAATRQRMPSSLNLEPTSKDGIPVSS